MTKPSMLCIAVLLAVLGACSKLTQPNMDRIKTGMTKEEVTAILGAPARSESTSVMGMSGATFYYKSGDSEITVTFVNDAVMAKSGSLR